MTLPLNLVACFGKVTSSPTPPQKQIEATPNSSITSKTSLLFAKGKNAAPIFTCSTNQSSACSELRASLRTPKGHLQPQSKQESEDGLLQYKKFNRNGNLRNFQPLLSPGLIFRTTPQHLILAFVSTDISRAVI